LACLLQFGSRLPSHARAGALKRTRFPRECLPQAFAMASARSLMPVNPMPLAEPAFFSAGSTTAVVTDFQCNRTGRLQLAKSCRPRSFHIMMAPWATRSNSCRSQGVDDTRRDAELGFETGASGRLAMRRIFTAGYSRSESCVRTPRLIAALPPALAHWPRQIQLRHGLPPSSLAQLPSIPMRRDSDIALGQRVVNLAAMRLRSPSTGGLALSRRTAASAPAGQGAAPQQKYIEPSSDKKAVAIQYASARRQVSTSIVVCRCTRTCTARRNVGVVRASSCAASVQHGQNVKHVR